MAPLKPSGLPSHFSHPLKGVWEKWEIPQGPQSPEWEKWEKWEGVGMDPRRIAPATVGDGGDGGDGLARTWLVLWPAIEPTPRKYQEPVSVERVLADHRAAVAAVPIIEGMGTCAAPIEAPAGCAQAGEGLRHCGSFLRGGAHGELRPGDAFKFRFADLIVFKCNSVAINNY